VEDLWDDEGEEEETDDIVNQVLDDLGIKLESEVCEYFFPPVICNVCSTFLVLYCLLFVLMFSFHPLHKASWLQILLPLRRRTMARLLLALEVMLEMMIMRIAYCKIV
jgi:hypothetical protein